MDFFSRPYIQKVRKNEEASASEGWTIVLMDRASRFIWHLKCGRKEQKLFLEAMMTVAELFERSAESGVADLRYESLKMQFLKH